MRIIRRDWGWRLEGLGHVIHDCLEALALEKGYRVCEVCQTLGVSQSYLRELFLRDVGVSPKEWMQWERMVVARRMLGAGVDPLAVADLVGYRHANAFRAEFRRVHGFPPLRFLQARRDGFGAE